MYPPLQSIYFIERSSVSRVITVSILILDTWKPGTKRRQRHCDHLYFVVLCVSWLRSLHTSGRFDSETHPHLPSVFLSGRHPETQNLNPPLGVTVYQIHYHRHTLTPLPTPFTVSVKGILSTTPLVNCVGTTVKTEKEVLNSYSPILASVVVPLRDPRIWMSNNSCISPEVHKITGLKCPLLCQSPFRPPNKSKLVGRWPSRLWSWVQNPEVKTLSR